MKNFFKILFSGFVATSIIYLIIAAYYLFEYGELKIGYFQSKNSVIGFSYGISLYAANGYLSDFLKKVVPTDTQKGRFQRMLLYIPGCIVLTVIIRFVIDLIYQMWSEGQSFSAFLASQTFSGYLSLVIIALVIGFIMYLIDFYKAYKDNQIREQKQIAGGVTAQLESLKNQIDPHFLFNSLNVLISLIEEDQKKAVEYTTSLSKMYRYILEQKDKDIVSIREELNFAESFITLLKLRFENAISYQVDIDSETTDAKTIPLVLQLLLENAIKHNIATEDRMLHITIWRENDFLVVKNNLQPKQNIKDSTKVGLQNIKERYALLSDKPVEISRTETEFIVKLPTLTTL